jgi:hypothetical protein
MHNKKPQIESENRKRSRKKRQQANKRQAPNKQNQRWLSGAEHNIAKHSFTDLPRKTIEAELSAGHEE